MANAQHAEERKTKRSKSNLMEKYKYGKRRYSRVYMDFVKDIFVKWKVLWVIPVWVYHDTLLDRGQVEEVVYLLNHPEEVKERLEKLAKNYKNFCDNGQ